MMFKDNASEFSTCRFQDATDNVGVLVDDGGVRADIDNAAHVPFCGVVQPKTQTGERLSASRGNGQEIDPFRADSSGQTGFRDLLAKSVNREVYGKLVQFMLQQVRERAPLSVAAVLAKGSRSAIRKVGSVRPVSIDQTTEQKSNQDADLESLNAFVLIGLADPRENGAEGPIRFGSSSCCLSTSITSCSAFVRISSKCDSVSALSIRRERLSNPLGVMQSIKPE